MDDPLSKFVLFVPLYYNDGRKVPKKVILDFEDRLFVLGSGFTDMGTVRGAYRMADGKKQIDHSVHYWIWLKEEYVPELRQAVAELGARLGQESMYLERTASTLDFVPPQPPKGGSS
jgi:hypothetical protein